MSGLKQFQITFDVWARTEEEATRWVQQALLRASAPQSDDDPANFFTVPASPEGERADD